MIRGCGAARGSSQAPRSSSGRHAGVPASTTRLPADEAASPTEHGRQPSHQPKDFKIVQVAIRSQLVGNANLARGGAVRYAPPRPSAHRYGTRMSGDERRTAWPICSPRRSSARDPQGWRRSRRCGEGGLRDQAGWRLRQRIAAGSIRGCSKRVAGGAACRNLHARGRFSEVWRLRYAGGDVHPHDGEKEDHPSTDTGAYGPRCGWRPAETLVHGTPCSAQ
jgi:hypothetical protein